MAKRITATELIKRKKILSQLRDKTADEVFRDEAIPCMTAYDFTFASLAEKVGVEVILVGDSLGMVLHGEWNTLGVTLDDIIYHSRIVRKGLDHSLLIADVPFGCCTNDDIAMQSSIALIQEGDADMVKIEGGSETVLSAVRVISEAGIPVCGHIGTLPQQALRSGYQSFPDKQADKLIKQAEQLMEAGALMLVLECVPHYVAAELARELPIPVIGIGSGGLCDGQILVLYDILGISQKPPTFSRDFPAGDMGVEDTLADYVEKVKTRKWPHTS